MNCALCGRPIDSDGELVKEVTGWVGGPKKDSMRLRTDTGRFAHDHCVTLVGAGQDPTQPDLFAADNRLEEAAAENTTTMNNLEELL